MRWPSPRGRGCDTTHGCATGTRGHAVGKVAPVGGGTDRTGVGGWTVWVGTHWPAGTRRTGPSWAPLLCHPPAQAVPLWSWAGELHPAQGWGTRFRLGQCGPIHNCLFCAPLSPGTQWEEEGTCMEASSSHCHCQTSDPALVSREGAVVTQRLSLNKDLGASHCGRPPGLGRQGPSLTSGKRTEQQGGLSPCGMRAVVGKFK